MTLFLQKKISGVNQFDFAAGQSNNHAVPVEPTTQPPHVASDLASTDPTKAMNFKNSMKSSGQITGSTHSNIREIVPWIDFDPGLSLPSTDNQPVVTRQQIISQGSGPASIAFKDSLRTQQMSTPHVPQHNSSPLSTGRRDYRKSIFMRSRSSRNPIAKLLDGTRDRATHQRANNYLDSALSSGAVSSCSTSPKIEENKPDDAPNTFGTERRNAIGSPKHWAEIFPRMPIVEDYRVTKLLPPKEIDDPFVDIPAPLHLAASLPLSLKKISSHSLQFLGLLAASLHWELPH